MENKLHIVKESLNEKQIQLNQIEQHTMKVIINKINNKQNELNKYSKF